jgi:hypothetical protein
VKRKEIRRARAGAHELRGAAHRIIPAATVWPLAASMRMKAPVARSSA